MKHNKRDSKKAVIVQAVAEKNGKTPRYVYAVLAGDRNNEQILSDYMELIADTNNLLLAAVKKAVPF